MSETFKCSSGNEYEWTQPKRFVFWRHGRMARTFGLKIEEAQKSGIVDANEQGLAALESMSPHEAERFQAYVDDVLRAGTGRADVDSLPESDYWELFSHAIHAFNSTKVKTTEGETTVETVEKFPDESDLSAVRPDVPDVRRKTIGAHGTA